MLFAKSILPASCLFLLLVSREVASQKQKEPQNEKTDYQRILVDYSEFDSFFETQSPPKDGRLYPCGYPTPTNPPVYGTYFPGYDGMMSMPPYYPPTPK